MKAKNDLFTALKIIKPPDPIYETAVYHCQQAAEKSLKGFLVYHDIKFGRTHDLESLIKTCQNIEQSFSCFLNRHI